MFADIRAVLFDLDGTLIDSAPDLGAAVVLLSSVGWRWSAWYVGRGFWYRA